MPAFGEDQITSSDLETLIRYLKGDYAKPGAAAGVALRRSSRVTLTLASKCARGCSSDSFRRCMTSASRSFRFALPRVGKVV